MVHTPLSNVSSPCCVCPQAERVPTDKPAPGAVCLDIWATPQDWRAAAAAGALDDLART